MKYELLNEITPCHKMASTRYYGKKKLYFLSLLEYCGNWTVQ